MKTIKFSDSEVDLLTQMYREELEMAKNYVKQIEDVLKKFGVASEETPEKPIEEKKKRGRKPQVKAAEIKEPKKRGRRPKETVTVPTIIESLIAAKQPVKEETLKIVEPKKRGRKRNVPTVESIPVIAEPVKKKREPKQKKVVAVVKAEKEPVVKRTRKVKSNLVPTDQATPALIAEPVKKEKKGKSEPKPKKEKTVKAKVEKKPVVKRTRKPKVEETPETIVESAPAESKETPKKVVQKKPAQKRSPKGTVTLTTLRKPLAKKEPKVEPTTENPIAEQIVEPTE